MCKPGALFRDLGKVMSVLFWKTSYRRKSLILKRLDFREPIAKRNGCSVVRTYTGHGTNNLFHCTPNIPHYAKNKAVGTMKPGMVSP